jgi:hypothetical protein
LPPLNARWIVVAFVGVAAVGSLTGAIWAIAHRSGNPVTEPSPTVTVTVTVSPSGTGQAPQPASGPQGSGGVTQGTSTPRATPAGPAARPNRPGKTTGPAPAPTSSVPPSPEPTRSTQPTPPASPTATGTPSAGGGSPAVERADRA